VSGVIRGAVAGVIALLAVPVLIAAVVAAVGVALLGGGTPTSPASAPSPAARADIPAAYLRLYLAAAGQLLEPHRVLLRHLGHGTSVHRAAAEAPVPRDVIPSDGAIPMIYFDCREGGLLPE
jgi:hypothetical protein